MGCDKDAKYRFTWPGNDESYICEKHVEKLRNVAKAMGFHLQVMPIDEEHLIKCKQQSN